MRVTTIGTYLTTASSLGGALERVQRLQSQIGTGKAVAAWSDDAPAATAAERYRSEESDWTSFQRSATDAQGWLGTADGTLQSMSSLMARAKSLAVSAVSGGLSDTSRGAIADELDQIRTEMRDLGNTQHLGRSLFGGFGAQALTTAADGTVSYSGDAGQVARQISPTITLGVNVTGGPGGDDLFGFGTQDVFSVLKTLSTAVRTDDAATLGSTQDALEARHSDILRGLAKVGATTNRVDTAYDAGSVALTDLASRRSQLEDVDLAKAVLQMSAAQAGYSAALGAASRANLPSLADFLR
ncbi:MAG: flagellar hook-associated protein FlgL [Mycobacteriales bacterium]